MTPYVPIYCEAKRERDYAWWPWLRRKPWFGKAYARDGRCCYCKREVKEVAR